MSDRKIRLPTSESIDSNNSGHNNCYQTNMQSQGINSNLSNNFQPNIHNSINMRRNFSASFNDNYFIHNQNNLESAFSFNQNGNRGYAFINFLHPYHILYFYERFEGKTWNFFDSRKICELNAAKFQGISEIKRHARNYKGQKKPAFFPSNDILSNIELPMVNILINLFFRNILIR